MSLKENYLNEMSLLKNERIERVVEAAKEEFNSNGIKNSKLRVIAKKAKVGEASIYRYFKDKNELIQFVSYRYWQDYSNFFDDYFYGKIINEPTGIKKVETALNIFHHLFQSRRKFLKFVNDFDNYYANEEIESNGVTYEEPISKLRNHFVTIFNEGIEDGSINPDFDAVEKYKFVSEVMVTTTQKLSSLVDKPNGYDVIASEKCISELIAMFINYIKT